MKFANDGVEIVEGVLTSPEIVGLIAGLPGSAPGALNLIARSAAVRALANAEKISALLAALGCPGVRPVRAVFFDKNPAHNWKVPWHQDLTIAVAARVDTPGYQAWSVKDDVPHVQPPAALLARMVTVRLHLDDCKDDNGPLRVIPGSHLHGRLDTYAVAKWSQATEAICRMRAGGAGVMRPLVLHASSPAVASSHRRVIHVEFSPDELTPGLAWFEDLANLSA